MEKNFPNFDLRLSYLFPPDPEGKKQKKEEQHFAYLNDRELDDLVKGAQAKASKYATKCAVLKKILSKTFFIEKKCTRKLISNYVCYRL